MSQSRGAVKTGLPDRNLMNFERLARKKQSKLQKGKSTKRSSNENGREAEGGMRRRTCRGEGGERGGGGAKGKRRKDEGNASDANDEM